MKYEIPMTPEQRQRALEHLSEGQVQGEIELTEIQNTPELAAQEGDATQEALSKVGQEQTLTPDAPIAVQIGTTSVESPSDAVDTVIAEQPVIAVTVDELGRLDAHSVEGLVAALSKAA